MPSARTDLDPAKPAGTLQFSPAAEKIVRALGTAGAFDRDKAITIRSPSAAARLVTGFFCQKRTCKPKGGSQTTIYWLTERGARAFRALPAGRR